MHGLTNQRQQELKQQFRGGTTTLEELLAISSGLPRFHQVLHSRSEGRVGEQAVVVGVGVIGVGVGRDEGLVVEKGNQEVVMVSMLVAKGHEFGLTHHTINQHIQEEWVGAQDGVIVGESQREQSSLSIDGGVELGGGIGRFDDGSDCCLL